MLKHDDQTRRLPNGSPCAAPRTKALPSEEKLETKDAEMGSYARVTISSYANMFFRIVNFEESLDGQKKKVVE